MVVSTSNIHHDDVMASPWTCALELATDRSITSGSTAALCAALTRGADLRIYTEFLFEEHIVPGGGPADCDGLIREVIDFRETIVLNGRHAAAITTLRQPLHPPFGFNGSQPMSSFFLYDQDGHQACANLWLDDTAPTAFPGTVQSLPTPGDMPKMSPQTVFDAGTTGPSRNFIYDMEVYRFFVRDDWDELLSHTADGTILAGSIANVEAAQREAREIKVGIRDLCADLGSGPSHEVFSHVGSGFFHVGPQWHCTLTHPLVRVRPAIPLHYASQNWDVAWVFLRTDGTAVIRRLDPHSRRWSDVPSRFAVRWFAH